MGEGGLSGGWALLRLFRAVFENLATPFTLPDFKRLNSYHGAARLWSRQIANQRESFFVI
jgi:hypothetical protein